MPPHGGDRRPPRWWWAQRLAAAGRRHEQQETQQPPGQRCLTRLCLIRILRRIRMRRSLLKLHRRRLCPTHMWYLSSLPLLETIPFGPAITQNKGALVIGRCWSAVHRGFVDRPELSSTKCAFEATAAIQSSEDSSKNMYASASNLHCAQVSADVSAGFSRRFSRHFLDSASTSHDKSRESAYIQAANGCSCRSLTAPIPKISPVEGSITQHDAPKSQAATQASWRLRMLRSESGVGSVVQRTNCSDLCGGLAKRSCLAPWTHRRSSR